MNECWPSTTINTSMLAHGKPPEQVSVEDLNLLLKGRKYGTKSEPVSFDMSPAIEQYEPRDMDELEEYCKKRGILGVNFAGMGPRQVLNVLKGRTENRQATTKRGLLNG